MIPFRYQYMLKWSPVFAIPAAEIYVSAGLAEKCVLSVVFQARHACKTTDYTLIPNTRDIPSLGRGFMLGRFLRTFFISLSKAGWAQRFVTRWGLAWRFASRFVAGQDLDQAVRAIQTLNDRGILATLDHLGEHTSRPEEARAAADEVIQALEAIDRSGVRSNISLKLSQLGLILDEDLCRENLGRILARAKALGNFIRIDMEDSSLTAVTLDMLDWAFDQGYDNTGIVIQSYLYRSGEDIRRILARGGRVRLCKGAYDEPAEVAFPAKSDVDANYDRLTTQLFEGALAAGSPPVSADGRFPPIPALATHDDARIRFAREDARRLKLPKGALEFQMLFGIRRDLQDALVADGYPVRVYVPYGTHWYPYFMRRLAERPANVWFFISNFFRK
jgi:proline dehydrogenase